MVNIDLGRFEGTARKVTRATFVYCLLVGLGFLFAMPLVWLLSTSLKSNEQVGTWPPVWIPYPFIWKNYGVAWTSGHFGLYFFNTATITVLATIGQLLTASMAAYGFARLRFPGREFLFAVLLATLMLPFVVTMIPTFILFKNLGLVKFLQAADRSFIFRWRGLFHLSVAPVFQDFANGRCLNRQR